MIASMTGFGKAVVQLVSKKISIEIKSLNSKNLDINMRIPQEYKEKELEMRKKIADSLVRGKVSFTLYIENTGVDDTLKINRAMVQKYMEELQQISPLPAKDLLPVVMNLPDTLSNVKDDIDPDEWQIIIRAMEEALHNIVAYRQAEGAVLQADFSQRIATLEKLLAEIPPLEIKRKEAMILKLQKALEDLKQNVDENRFEQELIYYLEKLDITEEQVRLKNHLDYYKQMLHTKDSNGRKLGFITQEIGREINTIGSKANFAPMQKIVVQMKDELEKIKEQNLNIL